MASTETALRADPEEFADIVSEYRTRLFHFLFQMVGDSDDALDLLQEGFARAFAKWHLRDPARPVGPWLYRICRNLAVDHLRKRSRRKVCELKEAHGHEIPEPSDLKLRLWKAINDLPETQREAFILREVHGLSYGEIAEVTGASRPAITARLHHGRQSLRQELREYL